MAVAVRLARNAPAKTVHPLEGFGGQLNTDLFTTTGQPNGLADAHKAELAAAIVNLNPGHSRIDRKSTRLNSSHTQKSRMPSSA